MKKVLYILLSLAPSLFADPTRQIEGFLRLGDASKAFEESMKCIYEKNPKNFEYVIRSLAKLGDDALMMQWWDSYHSLFADKAYDRDLLEEMCWGILEKGRHSQAFSTKIIALLGAALTQDVRAVKAISEGLNDSNSQIRSIAIELASFYGDDPLKEELLYLFKKEKSSEVRKILLKGASKLEMQEFLPELMQFITKTSVPFGEKKEAIKAIAELKNAITHEELLQLKKSQQTSLKILACECILEKNLIEEKEILYSLLEDISPEVKVAALQTIGRLKLSLPSSVEQLLRHPHPLIKLVAAWTLLINEDKRGEELLSTMLYHEKKDIRLFASGAIGASGKYGINLAKMAFQNHEDTYVKANLALALIQQRVQVEEACCYLDHFLKENHELWMWNENIFSVLQKSTHEHKPTIANYPEVMNQKVRLEMINLLALLNYPGTQELIKDFLSSQSYEITGLAAEMLLNVGDESALDLVRHLLNDPDPRINIEAALVLAVWGKDPSSVPVLLDRFGKANRSLQIKILESLGRIGDLKTVPFLVSQLKNPSQTLRMIAACVLIQTLNR